MSANQEEILFQDDPELVAELRAIRQKQEEHLKYEDARKAARHAGTPFLVPGQSRCLTVRRSEYVNIVQPE